MTTLYRTMKDDGEGMPLCGPTGRTLGVRREVDVPDSADGMVEPGTGGMSVALDDPMNLEAHRRPPAYAGGFAPDPLWQIESDDLPSTLTLRRDPDNPSRHGFIEPMDTMSLDDYQNALATSRGFWSRA
jgi:hypothetical protein